MKKILAAIVALSMVLSMAGTLGITSFATETVELVTYDSFPGTQKYSAAFGAGNGLADDNWRGIQYGDYSGTGWSGGWRTHGGSPTSHPGALFVNTTTQIDGTQGRALKYVPAASVAYASAEEIELYNSTNYYVNIGEEEPAKAFYYVFDPSLYSASVVPAGTVACTGTDKIHYLITIGANNQKIWYPIQVGGEALEEDTYDYNASLVPGGDAGNGQNRYFSAMWGGAPYMYSSGGTGLNIGLSAVSSYLDAYVGHGNTTAIPAQKDGIDTGVAVFSMDIKYENGSNGLNDSTTFKFVYNTSLFSVKNSGITFAADDNMQFNNTEKTKITAAASVYVADSAEIYGVKNDATNLTLMSSVYTASNANWRNLIMLYNFDTGVINLYYDGKPVYAYCTEDGKYYDEFKPVYALAANGEFKLNGKWRMNFPRAGAGAIGNITYIDNMKVKHVDPSDVDSLIVWSAFSNGQEKSAVTKDLSLKDKIKIGSYEYEIEWESSDTDVISNKGKVTRDMAESKTVTLTATVNEKDYVFENVTVLSKLGTVLVWDLISNGQAIKAVTSDLTLPLTVSDGEQDFEVVWKSSNTDAISNTGKVTRGSSNVNVTLTATVEGVAFPFNVVVTGKGVIPSVTAGITIDDMPGKVILEQDFENAAIAKVGQFINSQAHNSGGFHSSGGSAGANSVSPYIRVVPTTEDAENVAIALEPGSAYMYATEAEIEEINTSGYTVSYNGGAAQKGMHRNFGGVDYIITKDASNLKAWYKVADFSEETKAYTSSTSQTRANNKWFYKDGKPRDAEIGAMNVYNKIPSDMLKKDDEGNYKGVISYSFKLMTQSDSSVNVNGYPSLVLSGISSANNIFALKHDSMVSYYNYAAYKNGEKVTISGITANGCFLGKNANVQGNKTNTDELDLLSTVATRGEGQWVDYIIVMNLDDNYYSIYIDGKPLYLHYDGAYYNQFAIDNKGDNLLNAIAFNAGRFETYHGDFTYLDDFVVKYYYDNIYDVLTWESISDGQAIASVLLDLSLPKKINYKGKEQTVTWTSSKPDVISADGKVTRPDETTSVTLTAKVQDEEATFTVTVKGLTGKPAVFFVGDSLVSDYSTDSEKFPEKIQGFGYYVRNYFGDNVSNYVNAAQPGHGTMSFYHDPQFWKQRVERFLSPGDFVLIELGANDWAKNGNGQMWTYTDENGQEQSVTLGSTPAQYREYLSKYVSEIRAKGAHPIFVLPLFPGVHDIYIEDTEYGNIMKDVANELGVDVIDFRVKIMDFIKYLKTLETTPEEEKAGNVIPQFYEDYMYVEGDRTHTTSRGAKMYAKWMMEAICESTAPTISSLAEYVNKDMVKPTIYTAGDSLMCDWLKVFGPQWYPYQGWGSFLGDYFEGANVVNTAESGSTAASFFYQKNLMYERVMKHILPGDYLFVSTAPNDESYSIPTVTVTAEEGQTDPITGQHVAKGGKVYKVISAENSFDGEVHKFGANLTEYAANLKNLYIDEMRKYGVNVVFVTSVAGYSRKYNPSYRFIDTMKRVGTENNIPVIDLRSKHQQFIVDEYGYNQAEHGDYVPMEYTLEMQPSRWVMREKYGFTDEMIEAHPGVNSGQIGGRLEGVEGEIAETGDISHFNIEGAKVAARLAIEALYESQDTKLDGLKDLLDTDKLYLTEEVAVSDVSVTDAQNGVNVKATITKTEPHLQFSTKAIIAAYNGTKLVKSVTFPLLFEDSLKDKFQTLTKNDSFDYTSKADVDLTLEGEFNSNTTYKLFVWDMRNLKPIASVTLAN